MARPIIAWIGFQFHQKPTLFIEPPVLGVLQAMGLLGLLIWYAWCQPLVWAYDPASGKKISSGQIAPKRLAWWLDIVPRLAPFIPFVFPAVMVVLSVIDFGNREWHQHVAWLFVTLGAAAVFIWISHHVRTAIKIEFPRRLSMLGLCFGCGYNVSASKGISCPECGRPIDWVEPSSICP
ncbi:MAG: hypothetical protein AAF333_07880 [Planctomycetota bacterium]